MGKTFLKDAYIVSVYDNKNFEQSFLGEFLSGVVIGDETFRFRPFEQIVSSQVVTTTMVEGELEVLTHNGSCYVIDTKYKLFKVSTAELKVMRAGPYSPERILEIREQLKNLD
ncbi:hypothetical protein [Thalassotalea piscium]|uniref:Uncharacterized protein n=1 Tax=Thalassotalea piscium TaxID=1230533 RepID=A0A7X0NE60_9GAMM|nr:hypothetical protein [Thalassotalea piscium]MBB6541671.1 hypothetical protein [Thalassotalea piscium]